MKGKDAIIQEVKLRDTMADIYDVDISRARSFPRRAAYWWTEEIAELRRASVRARRLYTRSCKRRGVGGDEERTAELLKDLRAARRFLSNAIREVKVRAWDEQLASLERDPWRRLY